MRIGVGLSIPELATRGGRFSPASLFTGGVQGAWYDPSDYSTLFQDSAGTTPVTAVEQPVGLMLDKSQGLVLGSELVVNGDFSNGTTGWASSPTYTSTLSVVNGEGVVTVTRGFSRQLQALTTVIGQTYQVTCTARVSSGSPLAFIGLTNANGDNGAVTASTSSTSATPLRFVFVASATTTYIGIGSNNAATSGTVTIDDVSVKSLAGNHASQATAASRPVLRARYNLLTYSEQFDNAAWIQVAASVTANATTSPEGAVTADKLIEDATTGVHTIYQAYSAVSGTIYTMSFYAKAAERTWVRTRGEIGINYFNLAAGTVGTTASGVTATIIAVGNGWYRCIATKAAATTGVTNSQIAPTTADNVDSYAGTAGSGIYVWGAQIVTGSSAGTYQRIAAATDYATAGFLPYLALDGTDDSFGTNSINFTATDKMSVCAGVTKLADSAGAIAYELSADVNTNAGTFLLAPQGTGASAGYVIGSRGANGISVLLATGTTYAAPITNVVTATHNISGDSTILRVNGLQVATNTGDQGAGNFGSYPLYIGRRNNASLPFNGRIYQMVVCGKTLSASELAALESFTNSKTGAY